MIKKLLAICCATIICSSPIINSKNAYIISASAASDSLSYKDDYGVTYKFVINSDGKTAKLTDMANAKSNLILPSTVTYNGVSYVVNELDDWFGYDFDIIQSVTIPNTITTLGEFCFDGVSNLNTVYNGSELTKIGECSFSGTSWKVKQIKTKGYATLGKVLIDYDYHDETLDMSTSEYNNIEYISDRGFDKLNELKYLILPQNLKFISKEAFGPYNDSKPLEKVETVKFFDNSQNKYVDLYDVCMSDNRNKFQSDFLYNNYMAFAQTELAERAAEDYTQKILKDCGITYKGAPGNTGYTAFEEYDIVRKLYVYIGKNFNRYLLEKEGGSKNYRIEFFERHGIVCHDYAKMFEYLCNISGIDCKYVSTITEDNHAFNVVKIGDRWFNVDCCWTWNWSLQSFLTPDFIIENEMSNHHKLDEFKQYDCSTQMGDINFDGKINSVDASLIMKAYATIGTSNCKLTSLQLVLCDVNRDGKIDSVDASKVLAYYSYASTLNDSNGNPVYDVPSIEQYFYNNGYSIIPH